MYKSAYIFLASILILVLSAPCSWAVTPTNMTTTPTDKAKQPISKGTADEAKQRASKSPADQARQRTSKSPADRTQQVVPDTSELTTVSILVEKLDKNTIYAKDGREFPISSRTQIIHNHKKSEKVRVGELFFRNRTLMTIILR